MIEIRRFSEIEVDLFFTLFVVFFSIVVLPFFDVFLSSQSVCQIMSLETETSVWLLGAETASCLVRDLVLTVQDESHFWHAFE